MAEIVSEHLRNNGFELGASNPALYRSEIVNGFCHGDEQQQKIKLRSLEKCCKKNLTRDGSALVQQNILTKNKKCCTDLSVFLDCWKTLDSFKEMLFKLRE